VDAGGDPAPGGRSGLRRRHDGLLADVAVDDFDEVRIRESDVR
jgi:hypothetical protein